MRLLMISVLAGLGVLCGCSDDDSEPERQGARVPAQRCELVTGAQQVFVRLTGESADELCEAWSNRKATGDWTKPTAATQTGGSFQRVCVLYRGRTAAGLYAAGSISSVAQAKEVCGRMLDRGWDELGRPDPTLATDHPVPSARLPVRCAEGRCFQGDMRVSRPQSGSDCPGGRWTFALSRDQNAGVYRCR